MFFRKIVNDGVAFSGLGMFFPNFNFYDSLLLFPVCCLFFYYLSGFYLRPQKHSVLTIALSSLFTSIIISLTIFFVLLLDDIVVSYKNYYNSLLVLFIILFTLTFFSRLVITLLTKRNFKKKKWTINTFILGTGEIALKTKAVLEKKVFTNTFLGFISTGKLHNTTKDEVVGSFNEIEKLINENKIGEIIIAISEKDTDDLFYYIDKLCRYNIEIRVVPELYKEFSGNLKIVDFSKNPFASLTLPTISDWEACIKRFMDIVLSALALIVLSPLIGLFAVLIKRDSKGPVFYKQERIGRKAQAFDIIKFRTMYVDAEKTGPKLSDSEDSRVTKIGVILRKYRFDEIPQFWNVIKGEMSLVGPRPERQYYINKIMKIAPYYCLLYKIQPGLTSWGPIKIGYSDTIEKMIERLGYDLLYMNSMSLLNDFKILILTVEIIFRGKGV